MFLNIRRIAFCFFLSGVILLVNSHMMAYAAVKREDDIRTRVQNIMSQSPWRNKGNDLGEGQSIKVQNSTVNDFEYEGEAVWVEATGYSAFDPGNTSTTATGTLVRHGVIAADPDFIPLGSRVYIPGYGEAIAEDVGGAIIGNRIDVAFDTHEEALEFGRQEIEIYILE